MRVGTIANLNIQNNKSQFEQKQYQTSFHSLQVSEMMKEAAHVPSMVWENGNLIKNPEVQNYINKLENLNFLKKIYFVKAFCNKTGFPSLKKVTEKIDGEILRAVNKLSPEGKVNPLFIAYSSISSVGRNMALPGSDADGFYILTDKPQNRVFNRATVGLEIDQRILESTGKHFPEVVSKREALYGLGLAENQIKENKLLDNESIYKKNLDYSGKSYVEAGKLNIDIAKTLSNPIDKDIVNLAGFFVELLRSGKIVLNNIAESDLKNIKDSFFYKYSNMYRQEGLKGHLKPKLYNRIELSKKFNSMSIGEKFQVCKELWKTSFGIDNPKTNELHLSFDMGDVLEMYKKLR